MDSREIGGRLKKKERKKERKRIYVNVLHTFWIKQKKNQN